jgi:hypothetical protein
MIIPHQQLSPDTLQALVEEFVTRDGTDYGDAEVGMAQKAQQVMRQLEHGVAVILFDTVTESCSIVRREDVPADSQQDQ